MNKITFYNPKVNNNEETSFFVPIPIENKKVITDQISEIFIEEHYKKGKVKKDMIVIDCGANIGLASLYFKDWAKIIYALEPNPKNFECLVENTRNYPNIKPFCIGLTARTNIEYLRNNEDYPLAESLFGMGEIKEKVELVSIDDFMEKQNIDHLDLLKMDTEGSEYIIFPSLGFEKMAPRIDYIVGETHYCPSNLVPEFIPLILNDMGFDTQFLPINNYFITMSFDDVIKRDYKIQKQTIFFSKRKELSWPK